MVQVKILEKLSVKINEICETVSQENMTEELRTAFREAIKAVVTELVTEFEDEQKNTLSNKIQILEKIRTFESFWSALGVEVYIGEKCPIPRILAVSTESIRVELLVWMLEYSEPARNQS